MKFKVGDKVKYWGDQVEIIDIEASFYLYYIKCMYGTPPIASYQWVHELDLEPWGATNKKDDTTFKEPQSKYRVNGTLRKSDGSTEDFEYTIPPQLDIDFGDFEPAELEEDEGALELELPECSCDIKVLMAKGCQCGGV